MKWLQCFLVLAWSTLIAPHNHWVKKRETSDGGKKLVCYYSSWGVYRPGTAKLSPENIDPYLCTHLIYAFACLDGKSGIQPCDNFSDIKLDGFKKFTGLKTINKKLKTLLAVGGWNEGSAKFSSLVANAERRREFVKNAVEFLRVNDFDGVDLHWKYPSFQDGGKPEDRKNYAALVQELREEFDSESAKTGKVKLLLTMAVPGVFEYIDSGYDVVKLNRYLDFMNVLSFDYHSAPEPTVNHHSTLYPLKEESGSNFNAQLSVGSTINYYLKLGADREKLVLGIPTHGRSYTLSNKDANQLGAAANGPGDEGEGTRGKGLLAYFEICKSVKEDSGWTVKQPKREVMGPYAYKGSQWVGYDDLDIVKRKAQYVNEKGLGGIMFWSIDTDDFHGQCHGQAYPLIEAGKKALYAAGTSNNFTTSSELDQVTQAPSTTQGPEIENCILSETVVNGKRVCKNSVIFFDDFQKFDSAKWGHEIKVASKPDYEFTVYNNKPENILIKDEILNLKPTVLNEDFVENGELNLDRCTGNTFDDECSRKTDYFILPPVQSARITTRQELSFKFGVIEIEAQFPVGDWIAADIRLVPADHAYGPHYESGLVRVLSRGNLNLKNQNGEEMGSQTVEGSVMLGYGTNIKAKSVYYRRDKGWQDEFHNFTILWTPEDIAFLVDGSRRMNTMSNAHGSRLSDVIGLSSAENRIWSTGTSIAPFDQPFYLSLGVSAGGIRNFENGWNSNKDSKPWSNTDPRAMFTFWIRRKEWQPTWGENSAFRIKSAKITAL